MNLRLFQDSQKTPLVELGDPVQIGLVVKDVCRSADLMSSMLGIGPWRFEDWPPPDRPEWESHYNGQPAKWRTRLAFADFNNIEMELIECLEGNNDYTRFLAERGEGIHHLLFEVDDLESAISALAENGMKVIMGATGRRPGTRWILIDGFDTFGFQIEIRNKLSE